MRSHRNVVGLLVVVLAHGCGSARPPSMPRSDRRAGVCNGAAGCYRSNGGSMVIVPHLKFELSLSLHVLKYAEDHHALFIPWATSIRRQLARATLRDAERLIEFHEWQLGSLVQDYAGPSRIEAIAAYLRDDKDGHVREWATERRADLAQHLGIEPEAFAAFYADFLLRYDAQGFGSSWQQEHLPLIEQSAETLARQLDDIDLSWLERRARRSFRSGTKLLLYPSSFSRPQHAYGFTQQGSKVVLYRVGDEFGEVLATIFHELLHPLLQGWSEPAKVRAEIERLSAEQPFRKQWEEHGQGNYDYPYGWLEELFVHAIARLLLSEAGYLPREAVPRNAYCQYERAIYEALMRHDDALDRFDGVDGFIAHALERIRLSTSGADAPQYRYAP
jgi:hypothetical protein